MFLFLQYILFELKMLNAVDHKNRIGSHSNLFLLHAAYDSKGCY